MNKYFIIILLFLLISCSLTKGKIKITQKQTNLQAYAILSDKTHRIVRLCFPKKIIIKNFYNKKKSFVKIDYHYNSIETSVGNYIKLYKEKGINLNKISNNKKKTVFSNKSKAYIIFTTHYIEKNNYFTKQLKEYSKKMLEENKDTLHIGTVKEFKQKHKELFVKLTKSDSISIRFLDGEKLGKRITMPLKW
ncbi:hypothetical protein [Tenacibaculum ovolyticum]|uniref:hypothetical protein n=1 Tax=Tenacibaculum ovolyticum TaxID=104270 RepID=UPI003BAB1933